MRAILGSFLAINGALWWIGWLLVVFLFGMFSAFGPLPALPLPWQLLALPALTLILLVGDAMVVFGLILVGSDKLHLLGRRHPAIPERNPVGWFLLRSLRPAAAVLTLIFCCSLLVAIVAGVAAPAGGFTRAWVPTVAPTLLNLASVHLAGRLLDRFERKDAAFPW
jgi:hypothetical protein